jgi:hypothetical protein
MLQMATWPGQGGTCGARDAWARGPCPVLPAREPGRAARAPARRVRAPGAWTARTAGVWASGTAARAAVDVGPYSLKGGPSVSTTRSVPATDPKVEDRPRRFELATPSPAGRLRNLVDRSGLEHQGEREHGHLVRTGPSTRLPFMVCDYDASLSFFRGLEPAEKCSVPEGAGLGTGGGDGPRSGAPEGSDPVDADPIGGASRPFRTHLGALSG